MNYLFDEGNNVTTNRVGSFCRTAMNTPEFLFCQPFYCVIVCSARYNITLVRGKKKDSFIFSRAKKTPLQKTLCYYLPKSPPIN